MGASINLYASGDFPVVDYVYLDNST